MGKRKKAAKKPQGPRKKERLPTNFQCLFCNHENSVTVKMEKKAGIGQLSCKVCGQSFQSTINLLSAPVDVYADWIDACDTVAKETAEASRRGGGGEERYLGTEGPLGMEQPVATEGTDKEMDGFIEDDEDAEGEYAEA